MEDLIKVLEPFYVATKYFSYEENVSISSVFPVLHGLIDQLEKLEPAGPSASIITQFKQVVLQEISRRWMLDVVDISSLLINTSLLDPRFRQLTLSKLSDTEKDQLKDHLPDIMEGETTPTTTVDETDEPPTKKHALDILLGPDSASRMPSFNGELDQYLTESPSGGKIIRSVYLLLQNWQEFIFPSLLRPHPQKGYSLRQASLSPSYEVA